MSDHRNAQRHLPLRRGSRRISLEQDEGIRGCRYVCYLLCWGPLLNLPCGVDLKRTRDPAVLNTCDIVVDVGGVYDEKTQRFDHHQRGFEEIFGHGFTTKLSSAGLVYKYGPTLYIFRNRILIPLLRHFGKDIIASRFQASKDDEKTETLWLKMYKEFIEAIDAIDNGISQYPADLKPRYRSRTDVSSRVGHLNPAWNESVDAQVVDVSASGCKCVHVLIIMLSGKVLAGVCPGRRRVPQQARLLRQRVAPRPRPSRGRLEQTQGSRRERPDHPLRTVRSVEGTPRRPSMRTWPWR